MEKSRGAVKWLTTEQPSHLEAGQGEFVLTVGDVPKPNIYINLLSTVRFHSSVGKAMHWHRRGHGFKSRWSHLNFSGVYNQRQLLKLSSYVRGAFLSFRLFDFGKSHILPFAV